MNKTKHHQRPRPKTSPEGSTRSSASETLIWKIHDRKYSYPLKDRVPSSLEVLTSRDSIKCNDLDYFGTFLGPTVDETILVGLRMLINLGFALPPCDEPQPAPIKKLKPAKRENFSDASSQTKSSKTKSETSQTAISSMRTPTVDKPIGKSELKRIIDYENKVEKEPELFEEASPTSTPSPSSSPTTSSEIASFINEKSPEHEINVNDLEEEKVEIKEVEVTKEDNEEVGLKAVREIQNIVPKEIEKEVVIEQKSEKDIIRTKEEETPVNLPKEIVPIKQEKIKEEKPVEKKPTIEERESIIIEEPTVVEPNVVEDVTLGDITEEELLEQSKKEILALISSEIISEHVEEKTPPKEGHDDSKSTNIAVTSRQRRQNDVDKSLLISQKKSTPIYRPPEIVVASAKCAQDAQSLLPSEHRTLPDIPIEMKPQSSKVTESDNEATKRRTSSTTKRNSKGSRRSSEVSDKSTKGARRRKDSSDSKRLSGDSTKRTSRDSKSDRSPSGVGKISEEAMKSAQTMTTDDNLSSSEGSGYDSTEEKSSKIDKSSSTSSLQKQPPSPKSKDSSTDTYLCACRIQTECPARITEDEQCSCPSNISPIVVNCPFLKNQSTIDQPEKTKEQERPAFGEEKLQCDCYTSTSSTGYTSGSDGSNGNLQQGDCVSKGEVRYAITKITEYGRFTTFEVMKSTKKVPKFMPKGLEGVFVLKHKS